MQEERQLPRIALLIGHGDITCLASIGMLQRKRMTKKVKKFIFSPPLDRSPDPAIINNTRIRRLLCRSAPLTMRSQSERIQRVEMTVHEGLVSYR